jgi:hypothetical protein
MPAASALIGANMAISYHDDDDDDTQLQPGLTLHCW